MVKSYKDYLNYVATSKSLLNLQMHQTIQAQDEKLNSRFIVIVLLYLSFYKCAIYNDSFIKSDSVDLNYNRAEVGCIGTN